MGKPFVFVCSFFFFFFDDSIDENLSSLLIQPLFLVTRHISIYGVRTDKKKKKKRMVCRHNLHD